MPGGAAGPNSGAVAAKPGRRRRLRRASSRRRPPRGGESGKPSLYDAPCPIRRAQTKAAARDPAELQAGPRAQISPAYRPDAAHAKGILRRDLREAHYPVASCRAVCRGMAEIWGARDGGFRARRFWRRRESGRVCPACLFAGGRLAFVLGVLRLGHREGRRGAGPVADFFDCANDIGVGDDVAGVFAPSDMHRL